MSTVTVITPTMNVVQTLGDCIDSIRKQTYPILEHLVVDGGSTDGTVDLAGTRGARVILGPDCGLYHAMSKGIAEARGEIVHILNGDDRYIGDDVIATVTDKMRAEELDLCHGRLVLVDGNRRIGVTGRPATKAQLMRKQQVAHPTVFVRSDVYQRLGAFSPSFKIAGDTDWLLRVWDEIRIGYIDRELVEMRMGGVSQQNAHRSYKEALAAALIHGQPLTLGITNYLFQIVYHVFAARFRKPRETA